MQWLALHLPQLSLEAFCATLTGPASAQPVALLAEHRVQAVNAAAAAQGVQAGLQRATALALVPALRLADADAARDAAALQAVAHAALAFTPAVSLHDAQTVLMEVQASLRLFGGLPALQQRLRAALAPLGHRVQSAAAPTALGAALLARWQPAGGGQHGAGPDFAPHAADLAALQHRLDPAPVWLLGPGREHWAALQGMGLQCLADLRALPRSGLARRFGAGLLDELDRACGLKPDPRAWLALPERFDSRLELHTRADRSEQVLHGAGVLLARLVAWAQARQGRVAAFTLQMLHEPRRGAARPATDLHLALAEPALDAAHLQLLLRERLAQLPLAAPTLELQLHCRDLVTGPAPNGELFPTPAGPAEGLTRLLERLRARLGDAQVQCLEAVADHRPERATRT
ncbi:MAG: DNA polymerase Y family protein, partial [Burkholderiales bacterium]|nr:DNA polymerase Y family protein [Burkholderiales bacterium]